MSWLFDEERRLVKGYCEYGVIKEPQTKGVNTQTFISERLGPANVHPLFFIIYAAHFYAACLSLFAISQLHASEFRARKLHCTCFHF